MTAHYEYKSGFWLHYSLFKTCQRGHLFPIDHHLRDMDNPIFILLQESIDGWLHVGLDLVSIGKGVGHVEQSDDSHHLAERFLINAQFAQGGSVRVDAVGAAVGG